MKKRKPLDILLGLGIIAVLGLIAYGVAFLLQGEPQPGAVTVRTGDVRIETYTKVVAEEKDAQGVVHERIDIETEAADFPHLTLLGDLFLTTSQDPLYDAMYYTLYDGNLKEMYYRSPYFTYPEAAGTYYVVAEAAWGRQKHNFTTQHGFSFTMKEKRVHDE